MAEIFQSSNITFDELVTAYQNEATGLSKIVNSPPLSKFLERHQDYDNYLAMRKNKVPAGKFNLYLRKKGGIICSDDGHRYLKDAFYSSHLSACCELFNGLNIPRTELQANNISNHITDILRKYEQNPSMVEKLSGRLHELDAVRTIQILRSLSLVNIRTSDIRQISFGAGTATKDIVSIHSSPNITQVSSGTSKEPALLFKMIPQRANNIIVSDNDPQRKDLYTQISDKKDSNVIALNIDTYETLEILPSLIKNHEIGSRNFVVALRIDHRMLPNIELFFQKIYENMDDTADLIITMGSGHDISDFEGRVNKMSEIFKFLSNLKLKPTLIKLHGGGTLQEQQDSNSFSLSPITTFQILHCKLKIKMLKKLEHK